MKGTIFDVKEFSVHDGPGCRITLFLKGCPLQCLWCHNPEGLSSEPELLFKEQLCCHCGNCKKPCDHSECEPFDRCLHACPNGCLALSGEKIESVDLAYRLLKNKDLLEAMNGGITISGGEPLFQADFVSELADKLKGVHLAIQTSGFAPQETYKRVIDKFDFVMQDIKLVDRALHKKYTGVYNDCILENIEYLKSCGKRYLFRVPLIPGITDTSENLEAISSIVKSSPVELLSYNQMAGAKYSMVGREYPLSLTADVNYDCTRYFVNAKLSL